MWYEILLCGKHRLLTSLLFIINKHGSVLKYCYKLENIFNIYSDNDAAYSDSIATKYYVSKSFVDRRFFLNV